MFVHVPLTHTPAWSTVTAAGVPVSSTAEWDENACHISYFKAEHQAGFVGGVGELLLYSCCPPHSHLLAAPCPATLAESPPAVGRCPPSPYLCIVTAGGYDVGLVNGQ